MRTRESRAAIMQPHSIAFAKEAGVSERLALWGEFVRRHIGELEADTFGDPNFDGKLSLAEHRRLMVFGIDVTRHRVVRTPRAMRADDRGMVKIVAQLKGVGCFEQAGRKATLLPGEWVFYDATRTYTLANFHAVSQAAIFLPREDLVRQGIDLDRSVARRFTRTGHAAARVYQAIVGAQSALTGSMAPADDLGERLAELVKRALLEEDGVATDAGLRHALKSKVAQIIAANLRDPGLSLDAIAEASGCSKRYLHKLFESENQTLNSLIWNRRLEQARNEIGDPAQAPRTITDIAFSWGFSSSSHFSRLFRDRFGLSPRNFRSLASSAFSH
jgi:AraC-like DNA-binding protein